jgi:hypothetical protein
MAVIFTGLASIPRLLTMNPSNFPDGSPKTHLVGLSFHQNLFQVCNQVIGIPDLDDHIIHVGFNVPMQLISKAHLDRALIGCSYVFQPEGHSFVSICPVRGDERGLDLIFLLEHNLVIS